MVILTTGQKEQTLIKVLCPMSLVFHEDSKYTIPSTSAVSVFPNILQNFGQNLNQIIKTESLKTRIFCLNQGAFKEQSSRKSQNEFQKKKLAAKLKVWADLGQCKGKKLAKKA